MDPFLDLLAGQYVILSQVKMYVYTSTLFLLLVLFPLVSFYSLHRLNVIMIHQRFPGKFSLLTIVYVGFEKVALCLN